MTGFGRAGRDAPAGRVVVEARSLNHRGFSCSARLPQGWDALIPAVNAVFRRRFARGKLNVIVTLETPSDAGTDARRVCPDRARVWADSVREAAEVVGARGELDINSLACAKGLHAPQEIPDVPHALVLDAASDAAGELASARLREGKRLGSVLRTNATRIKLRLADIKVRAPARIERARKRLVEKVAALLDGRSPGDERLAQEIAFLAEKWSIEEEIVRLEAHLELFEESLRFPSSQADPLRPSVVGKRLSFVNQEMFRETNTIGAKANDPGITALVIEIKEELEHIREQVENIE